MEVDTAKKEAEIIDAFVSIKNCVILAQSYMESKEEIPEFNPLFYIIEDMERILDKMGKYYDVLEFMK